MKKNIILPDTSLCAIVRDEIMNPAGGIIDYVHSTVPYVETAIIVDTGSKDGTREALEGLKAKYPQLQVFDRPFDNYASCRNFALKKVKTKLVLVLDADERLTEEDFVALKKIIGLNPLQKGYKFKFYWVYVDAKEDDFGGGHNPRLFKVFNGIEYRNTIGISGEYLYIDGKLMPFDELLATGISIKHFELTKELRVAKNRLWYWEIAWKDKASETAPSDLSESRKWKTYNPRRDDFR